MVNVLKFKHQSVWQKDYVNSADPDQTAPEGAIWTGSTLFATPLSILRNCWVKSKIEAKIVWNNVFVILGHLQYFCYFCMNTYIVVIPCKHPTVLFLVNKISFSWRNKNLLFFFFFQKTSLSGVVLSNTYPVSLLYKSIAGRYWPVRVADGLIMAGYRFIKNASWVTA